MFLQRRPLSLGQRLGRNERLQRHLIWQEPRDASARETEEWQGIDKRNEKHGQGRYGADIRDERERDGFLS